LGIPQASELDEEVDLGAAASDATEDKGRAVVVGTEMDTTVAAAATLSLTLLLLGFGEVDLLAVGDTTTGATTAALVCAAVTISPVAVGDVPV